MLEVTIKEFKVGQTVYILGDGKYKRDKHLATAAEAVKVGRKYVTISGRFGSRFKETSESRPYLVELVDYGLPRLLFPSREAVDEYCEREELKMWVRTASDWEKSTATLSPNSERSRRFWRQTIMRKEKSSRRTPEEQA